MSSNPFLITIIFNNNNNSNSRINKPVVIFVGDLHHLDDLLLGAVDTVSLQDGVVLVRGQEAIAVCVGFLHSAVKKDN